MADPVVVLARGWVAEIYSGAVYVPINGLTEISFAPGERQADITTKDSGDYDEHLIARRTMEINLKGFRLESSVGDVDPGQAAVEALAEEVDTASIGKFKLTSPGGTEREFYASARMTALGGPIDEGQVWECTLKQSGDLI